MTAGIEDMAMATDQRRTRAEKNKRACLIAFIANDNRDISRAPPQRGPDTGAGRC
jgi:hypothetical protein